MSTQFVNFHFSAFKFVELLPNGSLEEREACVCVEEAERQQFTFYFIPENIVFLFDKVRQVHKVDSLRWEKHSHPEIPFRKRKC